ncbi:hypothetical protein KIM372_12450 [Bombiscardovia nodaiensis]|uniref:Uncharacterized protein n=1 Tax=Bombiscardovia nodaiensis TaxID=2932181 RepID=A0ABM8B995_9BIFI|nr:hypothetical protein KIM372_12450 [Bombiscardovia nodaiensis]
MSDESVMSEQLRPYVPLVSFLGETLGPSTEVVLHDVQDFSHSVVAISNGNVSGRTIGSPATDLMLRVWQNHEYEHRQYWTRYAGTTHEGHAIISSTFCIRNLEGQVIGFMCINIDNSVYQQASQALHKAYAYIDALYNTEASLEATNENAATPLLQLSQGTQINSAQVGVAQQQPANPQLSENFSVTPEDLARRYITSFAKRRGIEASRMSQDERLDLIRELEAAGIFLVKGAVNTVAEQLNISQPTVYRYLHQVRSQA